MNQAINTDIEALSREIRERGGTPITREEYAARVESGEWPGFGTRYHRRYLQEHEAALADLRARRLSPVAVGGPGTTRGAAGAWLLERVAEHRAVVESGDLLRDPLNRASLAHALRTQLADLRAVRFSDGRRVVVSTG